MIRLIFLVSLQIFWVSCALSPIANVGVLDEELLTSAIGPDGTTSVLSITGNNCYHRVYEPSGSLKWKKLLIITNNYKQKLLTEVGKNQTIYLYGIFDVATDFGGGVRNLGPSPSGVIIKYSPDGEYQWDSPFDITLGVDKYFLKEDSTNGVIYFAGTDPLNFYGSNPYDFGIFVLFFSMVDGALRDTQYIPTYDNRMAILNGFDVLEGKMLLAIKSTNQLDTGCSGVDTTKVQIYYIQYDWKTCLNVIPVQGPAYISPGDVSYGMNGTFTAFIDQSPTSYFQVIQYRFSDGLPAWIVPFNFSDSPFSGYGFTLDTSVTYGVTIISGYLESQFIVSRQLNSLRNILTTIDFEGNNYLSYSSGIVPSSTGFANDATFLVTGTFYSGFDFTEVLETKFNASESFYYALRGRVEGIEPEPEPLPSPNFCQIDFINCPDGRCVTSLSECLCMDSTLFHCFDGSCMGQCIKAPYDALPNDTVIEFSIAEGVNFTLYDNIDGSVICFIEIAPNAFNVNDNSPTASLTVRGVPSTEIISANLRNGTSPGDLRHVLSSVIDFEFSLNVIQPVTIPIKLSYRVTLPSEFETLTQTFCLAFINNNLQWECASDLMTVDNVTFTGLTSHFTPFGVLLTGRREEEAPGDEDEVIGGSDSKGEGVPVKVVVPVVVCIIVVVIAVIVVGVIILNRRKKKFHERLKGKMNNNNTSNLTQNDKTEA